MAEQPTASGRSSEYPSAFAAPESSGANAPADSVLRIDFSSESDGITRLDFSSGGQATNAQPQPVSQAQPQAQMQAQAQAQPQVQAQMQARQQAQIQAQQQAYAQQQAQAQARVQQQAQTQLRDLPQIQQQRQQPQQQQPQQQQRQQPQQQHQQQAAQAYAQADSYPANGGAQQVSYAPAQEQRPLSQNASFSSSAAPAASVASGLSTSSSFQQNSTAEELAADRAQAANKPSDREVAAAKSCLERVIANVETVVIGKREPVSLVVLALIAKGHVLLEDLPGTGKTTLVSALARSIACDFSRIQFTPDIMPSDVSGFSIYNQKTNDFEFRPGGVMSNLVLADEINRASAKTQSALLEAMEERQVTVDGKTYRLPEPFMVLATQNPIEQFGTYPLPEAQVDRFLVKLSMGYPAFEQEVRVLELGDKAKRALTPVVSSADVLALRGLAARVYASRIVLRYIVEIITATRNNPEVQVGSSPRGGIALLALSRAYALLQGRNYVVPDDVKALAPHVLCHRVSLAHEAKVAGRTERQVIETILSSIAVPYYDESEAQGLR